MVVVVVVAAASFSFFTGRRRRYVVHGRGKSTFLREDEQLEIE
jgi:hypothetical protein